VQVPDYDGLTAIGQKMKMQGTVQPITQTASQAAASQPANPADKLVDEGVKAFSAKDYATASEKFRSAVRLEPNDTVLPFMYAQALFANNEYEKSASVLDTVLTEMGPRQQRDVFYPRGLYSNETVLQSQIKNLERAVNMDPKNADLHLLLGYHYLGTGRLDEARSTLAPALNDKLSALPAQALVNLIEQVKQTPQTDPNSVKK
jgi:tetratricopeptide (TPR) repeat protein